MSLWWNEGRQVTKLLIATFIFYPFGWCSSGGVPASGWKSTFTYLFGYLFYNWQSSRAVHRAHSWPTADSNENHARTLDPASSLAQVIRVDLSWSAALAYVHIRPARRVQRDDMHKDRKFTRLGRGQARVLSEPHHPRIEPRPSE